MPMHTFCFVLVSALILFYFTSKSYSKFKFVLNSNVFANYKGLKYRRALLYFWAKTLAGPAFFFFLSAWPNTNNLAVSVLLPFLHGPMAQLAFPACSPGSPATAHPTRSHLLRRVKTEAGEFSPFLLSQTESTKS
jgi:hypothetical protein